MALPVLKLDLAPPSTFWRLNHAGLGWTALAAGALTFLLALGATLRAYHQASEAGRKEVATRARTRHTEDDRRKVLEELRGVDVTRELPRWRLAERILTERSLPWSRLTAELERSLVLDVRLKSLQRTRSSDHKVQIKVKGEALSRRAEAAFVVSLQKNPFFEEVVLEREAERAGGGVDFEIALVARQVPPPYQPLPAHGPRPEPGAPGHGQAGPGPARAPRSRPSHPGGEE